MRYHLVAGLATSAFTFLAAADTAVPSGCTHQDGWGNAVVQNKCSEPVYFILDNQQSQDTIAPGASTSIPIYQKNADKGGMSIKLFKDKDTDIWSVPAITQFELTATDLQYFDISNVNSDIGTGKNGNGEACDKQPPFMNDGLQVSAPGVKDIVCAAGQNPCNTAYSMNNDDWATSATPLGGDVTLTICPGGSSAGTSQKPAGGLLNGGKKLLQSVTGGSGATQPKAEKPAPKPKAPAAPKVEQKNQAPQVVVVTSTHTAEAAVVTKMVQVQANEKRHEHLHHHVHNKIHKRRHGA